MELREQRQRPTLAQKLGDVTHVSPLLWKVKRTSGCSDENVGEWLLKCAVERGATHYRRSFDPRLPGDSPALSNEEVGVALCLGHHTFNPDFIRAAAQLLSAPDTDAETLAYLAKLERCEPVLLHVASATARIGTIQPPWSVLSSRLQNRRRMRTEALPHWSRFVLQTGYTPAGRGEHIEWLTRG